MKHIYKSLSILVVTASLLITANALQADHHEGPTVAEIAAADTDNFSLLVTAVVKADLLKAIDGRRQITVFAPTNDAFDAAATALGFVDGAALIDALSPEEVRDILLYHIAPGERDAEDVTSSTRVRTLSKQFIYVDGTVLSGSTSANILVADVMASNGIIHVIDFVLLP